MPRIMLARTICKSLPAWQTYFRLSFSNRKYVCHAITIIIIIIIIINNNNNNKCESVQHLVCGCEKLAQKEYKRRHDNVAKKVHWDFCKKNGLEHTEKWYEHVPEGVVENEEVKVGNCKDIEESVGNVKKRSDSVSLWSFVMTRLTEEKTAMTTART